MSSQAPTKPLPQRLRSLSSTELPKILKPSKPAFPQLNQPEQSGNVEEGGEAPDTLSRDFVAQVSKFNRKLGLVSSKFMSRAQVDSKFCNIQSYLRAVNKLLIDMVGTDLFIKTANLSVCSESLNTSERICKIKNILKTNLVLNSADEHLPSGRN